MFRSAVFASLLFAALAARSSLADVAGRVTVIDGDTIVVAGERVRLQGIDVPEMRFLKIFFGCVNRITNENSIVHKNRIPC